jgi:hypothetical protein
MKGMKLFSFGISAVLAGCPCSRSIEPELDGGNIQRDGGQMPPDAEIAMPDGGPTSADAAEETADGGEQPSDAALFEDGGEGALDASLPVDGGPQTSDAATSISDAGQESPDGGGPAPDGGASTLDGGSTADGGEPPPDAGEPVRATLTVQKLGTGSGTVTGTGIDCGSDCSETVDTGTTVTLAAVAAANSSFSGWVGCRSTSATTCTATVSRAKTVTATFTLLTSSVVQISRNITSATTWSASNLYVIDRAISVSGALTIEPGTIVKFAAGASITVSGIGVIIADAGAAATPIVFTSIKDDAYGGDTNADGDSRPSSGDWTGIRVDGQGSVFNFCRFFYAGGSGDSALTLNARGSVKSSIFAHNRTPTDAITTRPALNAAGAAVDSVLTGNLFFDNRVPLWLNSTLSLDDSNTFDDGEGTGNEYNGIFLPRNGHVVGSVVLSARKVPFVVQVLYVDGGASLSLADGVVVKFFDAGALGVTGRLVANASRQIIFTSIKDDLHGGDTNGDGAASAPGPGSWRGVALNGDGSSFESCQFLYGGQDGASALDLGSQQASVKSSVFAHNGGKTDSVSAVAALNAATAKAGTLIAGNTFFDNTVPLRINTLFSLDNTNRFNDGMGLGNKFNGIFVRSRAHVVGNIEWSATEVPLVIGVPGYSILYVDAGAHLTLASSTIVKFFPAGYVGVSGILTANATEKIVFTSIYDDLNGGDTNGDGLTTGPIAGSWRGISIAADGSSFDRCNFYYAGQDNASALDLGAQSASVTRSIFAYIKGTTDSITAAPALDASSAKAGTVIAENSFFDNFVPLWINTTFSLDDSNHFDDGGATPVTNKYNGIFIRGNAHVAAAITLSATEAPFVIGRLGYPWLQVDAGGHLTLGADVVMKFHPGGYLYVATSGLFNLSAGDALTSIRDDQRLGDTNGDGSSTTAADGDWRGVKRGTICDAADASYLFYQAKGCW